MEQSFVTVNQNIIDMEYAVRGPIPQRAEELKKQGMTIIPCNIGNPQALGQNPITFYRQVLSLVEEPSKIDRERKLNRLLKTNSHASEIFNNIDLISDYVIDLSENIISKIKMGAYSDSAGQLFIREAIAKYIDKRDEVNSGSLNSNPDNIFLTNGASEAVKYIIDMLIAEQNDGIMIPIPQYPLYSATIKKVGGIQVNYYLDEENGWIINKSMLENYLSSAKKAGVNVKAIVVINPGNPTGAIFNEETIMDIIKFAKDNNIAILADEVYQENLYGHKFVSFAKMLGKEDVTLFSIHSISKGFYGECGHRGGYIEVRNPPKVKRTDKNFMDILLKLATVNLCPNTVGQLLTYLMVSPPYEGTGPYRNFIEEKNKILIALQNKAEMIKQAFKQMDSVECFGRTGSLYLFPRLNKLPEGTTDFDYCMKLLENTGLCTVNGGGFGQKEGTNHLRIAFLAPMEVLEKVLPIWVDFHNKLLFMN